MKENDFKKNVPHEFHSGISVECQGYEWDKVGAIWGFLLLYLCQSQTNPLSFETNSLLEDKSNNLLIGFFWNAQEWQ